MLVLLQKEPRTVQSGEQDSTVESLSSSLQPPENITIAIETRAVSQINKRLHPILHYSLSTLKYIGPRLCSSMHNYPQTV